LLEKLSRKQQLNHRQKASPLTKPARSLEFDPAGFEDLAFWVAQDRKKALRIIKLIKEVQRDPFCGMGKPEP
jgi:toxin YoeB